MIGRAKGVSGASPFVSIAHSPMKFYRSRSFVRPLAGFSLIDATRMLRRSLRHPIRRLVAATVLVTYVAGCTHTPTGQKAFDSFEQCIAGNLGIAAAGGIAIGALGKALARQITGDTSVQNRVATAAGVAGAVMIGMTAWRKCAAAYNKSEPVGMQTAAAAPPPATAPHRRLPGVSFDRLDVRVEGTENDPPVPEFEFFYTAEDGAAQDIKAQFRHKVEIVRFKSDDNDQLILTDATGEAMRDASGRPIPLGNAIRMPRERLSWVTIAEDGRDDYVEDVVIQQGRRSTYRHKLQVPPRAQLPIPLPVPMRYTVTVEAERNHAARTVDFALLTTGERPRRYASSAAQGAATERSTAQSVATPVAAPPPAAAAPAAAAEPKSPVSQAFEATHSTRRGVPIYDQAGLPRKSIGRLNRGQLVRVDERADVQTNNRSVHWMKITAEDGKSGWLPANEVTEAK